MFNEYLLNRKQGGAVSFENFSMNIKEPIKATIKGKFEGIESIEELLIEIKKISKALNDKNASNEEKKEAYTQAVEKAKELITSQTQTEPKQKKIIKAPASEIKKQRDFLKKFLSQQKM